MSWMSGPCLSPAPAPAGNRDQVLLDAILDLTAESMAQGRAIERGDLPAAARAYRASLAATAVILAAARPQDSHDRADTSL